MAKPPSINPLANFNVSPLTAGKMSSAYAKALSGAVTTPEENQRLLRGAGKVKGIAITADKGGLSGAIASIAKAAKVPKLKGI